MILCICIFICVCIHIFTYTTDAISLYVCVLHAYIQICLIEIQFQDAKLLETY